METLFTHVWIYNWLSIDSKDGMPWSRLKSPTSTNMVLVGYCSGRYFSWILCLGVRCPAWFLFSPIKTWDMFVKNWWKTRKPYFTFCDACRTTPIMLRVCEGNIPRGFALSTGWWPNTNAFPRWIESGDSSMTLRTEVQRRPGDDLPRNCTCKVVLGDNSAWSFRAILIYIWLTRKIRTSLARVLFCVDSTLFCVDSTPGRTKEATFLWHWLGLVAQVSVDSQIRVDHPHFVVHYFSSY